MPLDCTGDITGNILYDCLNTATGGIEQNVVIIKRDDINFAETVVDPDNRNLITSLVLKATKTGRKIQGVKQSNGKSWELVKKENMPDKFKHTFSGVVFAPSIAAKAVIDGLTKGAKYVIVVEQTWKGLSSKDAFEVLGLTSGLEIATMTNNSKENDNMIMFELSSADGFEESTMPKNFLDGGLTDGTYALSKTAFDGLFASA